MSLRSEDFLFFRLTVVRLLEKIAVMVVTSSADWPQIYSERVRNLSGFNRTKLKQDGGNPV